MLIPFVIGYRRVPLPPANTIPFIRTLLIVLHPNFKVYYFRFNDLRQNRYHEAIVELGIVFAMANPVPEIMPEEAKAGGAAVIGTGRSDYPNQINNVLIFPGIFKGALSVRAKEITESMKQRAAYAIAGMIPEDQLHAENIIPSALDKSVADVVAKAVADTAVEEGIARIRP